MVHSEFSQFAPLNLKKQSGRPYRSHRYPACTRCKKRRSRCTIDLPGTACLLCRMYHAECSSAATRKDQHTVNIPSASLHSEYDSREQASQVVSPVVARDAQIFERYIPSDERE